MEHQTFNQEALVAVDGVVDVGALVSALMIDRRTLTSIAGLPRSTLVQAAERSPAVEARLLEIIEILTWVAPWSATPVHALAWYRAQALPGLSGLTAQELVKRGRAADVKSYLAAIEGGGYA